MSGRWPLSVEVSEDGHQQVVAYLDAVLEASADPDVTEALWAQIDDALQACGGGTTADVEAVLAALESPEEFGARPSPVAPSVPEPVDRSLFGWLGLAAVVLGVPASTLIGGVAGEEAGGTSIMMAVAAGVVLGAIGWRQTAGKVALLLAVGAIVLFVAVLAFDL